ncbi:MAG: hypothetical protein VW810_00515 [Pelagibacteraceae bacterium]
MRYLLIFMLLFGYAYADTTQNNTSGSNTNISGGYSSTANNTYQSGSSNNTTTTNNSTSNIKSAPPSAYAPNVSNSMTDICSVGASAGLQTFGLGISGGKGFRDETCEIIKLARELKAHGMSVAAVALLCSDPRVFQAMAHSATFCPYNGKIGKDAQKAWEKYHKLRPDQKEYIKNQKIIKETDAKFTNPTNPKLNSPK